jgi:hypothetical protein
VIALFCGAGNRGTHETSGFRGGIIAAVDGVHPPLNSEDHPTALERAGREYATRFGWHTVVTAGRLLLPMGQGIAAVSVPRVALTPVITALKQLDAVCPCVLIPGEEGRVVIMAEWDGLVLSPYQAPPGSRLALPHEAVPLPPTRLPGGVVRWVVAPHHTQRYLPTLSAVMMSVGVARRTSPWS